MDGWEELGNHADMPSEGCVSGSVTRRNLAGMPSQIRYLPYMQITPNAASAILASTLPYLRTYHLIADAQGVSNAMPMCCVPLPFLP